MKSETTDSGGVFWLEWPILKITFVIQLEIESAVGPEDCRVVKYVG